MFVVWVNWRCCSIHWTIFSYKGNYKVSQKENLMLKCPQRPESDFNLRHQNPLCLTNFSWRIFFDKFLISKHSFETWRKLHSEKKIFSDFMIHRNPEKDSTFYLWKFQLFYCNHKTLNKKKNGFDYCLSFWRWKSSAVGLIMRNCH